MIDLESLRPQFSVYILAISVLETGDMNKHLIASGYPVQEFIDQEVVLAKIKDEPPHMLVFHPNSLKSSMSEFVESVLDLNPEIQLICIAPASQVELLMDYREFNLAQVVTEGEGLHLRLLWTVDTIAENLYRSYQNEHLQTLKRNLETELSKRPLVDTGSHTVTKSELYNEENTMVDYVESSNQLELTMEHYRDAANKEDLVKRFFSALENKKGSNEKHKAIYFRFLPTVQSIVATDSFGMDIDSIKGVGCRLNAEELKDLSLNLKKGIIPNSFLAVLSDGLQLRKYQLRPLFVQKQLDCLMLAWDCDEDKFKTEFSVFELIYQNMVLEKKFQSLDVFDLVTGLINRTQYYKKLDEEIARARRLLKPVAVIKFVMDKSVALEAQLGRANMDVVLKTITAIIKKGGRVNDIVARTQDYEFSVILPHSQSQGALLRAERLRRMVESHSFGLKGFKISISCGVSEYPRLSTSASELDLTALEAMKFVTEKGGNRVCLYTPVRPIKPDFEVTST